MKTNKTGVLSGTALKLIAMVSMVFDHVGDNFFPDMVWMRVLGRIAMPIFAFCVAEGFDVPMTGRSIWRACCFSR